MLDNFLWRALANNPATFVTAFWSQIDDPVGAFDDFWVMLNHYNGISFFYQHIQGLIKFADVVEMKTGCGLVEDEERVGLGVVDR